MCAHSLCHEFVDGNAVAAARLHLVDPDVVTDRVGNLLRVRPECPLPAGFVPALRAGLEAEGVDVSSDWLARAEYLDLASACEFLSSREDRPETHARARAQIESTLARAGLAPLRAAP